MASSLGPAMAAVQTEPKRMAVQKNFLMLDPH
jgi:hypothetical protein